VWRFAGSIRHIDAIEWSIRALGDTRDDARSRDRDDDRRSIRTRSIDFRTNAENRPGRVRPTSSTPTP
jgi:hypothetical protein